MRINYAHKLMRLGGKEDGTCMLQPSFSSLNVSKLNFTIFGCACPLISTFFWAIASSKWVLPDPFTPVSTVKSAISVSGVDPVWWAPQRKDWTVRVGLLYQTCDVFRCLPPVEQVFDLKLEVVPG